jgi:hypothetical protein
VGLEGGQHAEAAPSEGGPWLWVRSWGLGGKRRGWQGLAKSDLQKRGWFDRPVYQGRKK